MIDFNLFPTDSDGAKHFGWAGPKAAKEAWDKVKNNFDPFKLEGKSKKKSKTKRIGSGNLKKRFLWEIVRKLLGKDLLNYAQQAGSCVSEGARSVCNYLAATQILLAGKSEKFKESYAPYHYGTMRVFIGAKHGTSFGYDDDGGIGSYMAEAFGEYGNLFADTPGIPEYTGQAKIARDWGYRPGPKKEYVELGKQHLIKKVARITSWEDYVDAITNGYPIHFCSMLSWSMMPNSKGYHDQTNEGWAHCMSHIGVDDEDPTGFCEILNSWADCHGRLKNKYTEEALPVGIVRSKKSVIARALEDEDVEAFAVSDMDGFYERKKEIDKALFDLFGN